MRHLNVKFIKRTFGCVNNLIKLPQKLHYLTPLLRQYRMYHHVILNASLQLVCLILKLIYPGQVILKCIMVSGDISFNTFLEDQYTDLNSVKEFISTLDPKADP